VVEDRERESLPAALAGPRRREARPVDRLTRERSPVCRAAPLTPDNVPHNIGWTHPEEVNKALLEFVDQWDKKLAGS